MKFYIDDQYLSCIHIRESWYNGVKESDMSDEEKIIAKLSFVPYIIITRSEDHPEFAKLRNELGKQGFIYIERGWWNGDRVKKPFTLNDVPFRINEKFSSAGAMHYHLLNSKKK